MHFLSARGFLRQKNGRVLIIFNGQYDNFQKTADLKYYGFSLTEEGVFTAKEW